MAASSSFPILDCGNIVSNSESTSDDVLKDFGKQFVSVLTSNRMCYIKQHGIGNDLKEKYMDVHRNFFTQSANVKGLFERQPDKLSGWFDKEKGYFTQESQSNELESYSYHPRDHNGKWPDAEFELYNKKLFAALTALAGCLFDALSLGLGLKKYFMRNAHKQSISGKNDGVVLLKTLYYHPCCSDSKLGDTRFGEHVDASTITILLQDEVGGLEVDIPGRGFVPVTPIPDTVVILAGDLLQRWSSDTIQAAKHRVVPSAEESRRQIPRQSIMLFVVPDRDFVIKPLDGSDKYKPITSPDYMAEFLKKMRKKADTASANDA